MVQDVVNAFYIKKLFDNLENVKIVLVVSEDTLGATKVGKLLNLLKKLGNLFVKLDSNLDLLLVVKTLTPSKMLGRDGMHSSAKSLVWTFFPL